MELIQPDLLRCLFAGEGVAIATGPQHISVAGLRPDERAQLTRAVASRRQEFAAGRDCLRRALAACGAFPESIPRGRDREPVLPDGFAASVTHCSGFCGAAAVRKEPILSIGFDAELAEPLEEDIEELVCVSEEREWLKKQGPEGRPLSKLLFSAKESVFKCWFPVRRCYLDFQDVRIEPQPESGEFAVVFLDHDQSGPGSWQGRYVFYQDWVFTAVTLTNSPAGR
jgi:4'-phosphopantetheinyl transferase EntD